MSESNNKPKQYFLLSTLQRGLEILDMLAEQTELSVSETAARLNINRSSAHRFLSTLRESGYVVQNSQGRYQASFRLFELGQKVVGRLEIIEVGHPFLVELADLSRETINLGYWENNEILHIDKINSTEILRMDQPIGDRGPAYATALGKAILAALPEPELQKYMAGVCFEPKTPKTISCRADLLKELEVIRLKGYAVDDEELCLGLRCVSSPVFNHNDFPGYAVSISGPTIRMTLKQIGQLGEDIRRVANNFSKALGAHRP